MDTQEQESGLTLQELIELLWQGRLYVAGGTLLAAALALAYLWVATPIYMVDALIQVEEKKAGAAGAMFGELGTMFDMSSPAEAEIEILRSRMVLGKVVQDLQLDLVAVPKTLPVIGKALLRRNPLGPKLELGRLDVPEALLGQGMELVATGNDGFTLFLEDRELLKGQVGIVAMAATDSVQIFVRSLRAEPGQKFMVARTPLGDAITDLSETLTAMEKGKKTGIIALRLQGPNPALARHTLNAIAQAYVQQNVDRKSAEAEKTLAFLRSQLPELKRRADSTEGRFNEYRLQVGSIDLDAESKLVLDQGVSLESDMLRLQQQRSEMERLYKEDHPSLRTLDTQLATLRKQMGGINAHIKTLPKTQQEILRLAQESKVAAELYNNMLNNAQQLEVAKAGQVGNVRIIDLSQPTYKPIKPKKSSTFVLACMLGAFVGAGIVLLRRFWSKGVEDPKVIESKLGLPVYATIPHSRAQSKIIDLIRKKQVGAKLLSLGAPDDLSVESFRSLRTTLHFSMHTAPNNVLLLVGPSPAIGKSFVCANLASVLAQTGKRVCLIDADMRRGHLHESFDMDRVPGLSDFLSGLQPLSGIIRETAVPGMHLITTGQVPPNPSELSLGPNTALLLDQLSKQYDIVLIDSAPLLAVADALVLAKLAGTTMMILKHGAHRMNEIEAAIARLEHAEVKVKGFIFNDVRIMASGKYGYAAKYGYAYQYGYGKKGEK